MLLVIYKGHASKTGMQRWVDGYESPS